MQVPEILLSKRVWTAVGTVIAALLVAFVPSLEDKFDTIVDMVFQLAMLVILTFGLQDAAIAFKTGRSKYRSHHPDDQS